MLHTRAESSGYTETSSHADVMAFLSALADRGDPRVHLSTFGLSPQGRVLPYVVLSTRGIRTPEQAHRSGLPVVLLVDGIHPGEVEGKEATLALLRDIVHRSEGSWLDEMTLVIVPLFNPDGNDALDPENRRLDLSRLSGQPGPVVGTRTQSDGINLNRDYMRHAALEMRRLQHRIAQPWRPHLTIDNHATNGSVHRMEMTVDIPHTEESGRREPIAFMRDRLVPEVTKAVASRGVASGWYGNFVEDEAALSALGRADPEGSTTLGWTTYPHHPRFGSNYRGLTNRLDLLLECYSYLPFERRVQVARAWQVETLSWVAAHAEEVRDVVAHSETPPDEIAVRYRLEAREEPVTIPTTSPRTPDGDPVEVTLPHHARFVGEEVVRRPLAYAVHPRVGAHLKSHGLRVDPAPAHLQVEIPRVASVDREAGRAILESASFGDVQVAWRTNGCAVPDGWQVVRTAQPLGAVAVYLCEPRSDDGIVENGIVAPVATGSDHPAWRVLDGL